MSSECTDPLKEVKSPSFARLRSDTGGKLDVAPFDFAHAGAALRLTEAKNSAGSSFPQASQCLNPIIAAAFQANRVAGEQAHLRQDGRHGRFSGCPL